MSTNLLSRFRKSRPNSGGYWLWKEDGENAVRLLLCDDGSEVNSVDDAEEGTPQYYWEQTQTTQKEMPGLWMKERPIRHHKGEAAMNSQLALLKSELAQAQKQLSASTVALAAAREAWKRIDRPYINDDGTQGDMEYCTKISFGELRAMRAALLHSNPNHP